MVEQEKGESDMNTSQENTDLDYELCDLLDVCMDELDELPVEDLFDLRDLIRKEK